MEKKTIGGLIAALRKAEGMTQRDLAERLHVSDKTISRWERGDGAPDLSAIPVLAELFGVTCDELLRGERQTPEDRASPQIGPETTRRGEKERQRLFKATLSQYRSQTCIAMGVAVCGFLVALICNFAFLRAILGFLCGALLLTASVVCQAIFVNRAQLRVEDAELSKSDAALFRRSVVSLAELSVGVTVGLLGFALPLLSVSAYMGVQAKSLLSWGAVCAACCLLVYAVILFFLNAALVKRGFLTLSETKATLYRHNHLLKKRCAALLVVLLAVTFVAHQAATTIYGPFSIMEGTTFTDYDSFVAFMEQKIPYNPYDFRNALADAPIAEEPLGEVTYYDAYGNEISETEARTRTLEDQFGNVLCTYVARNETVSSVRYSPGDGTALPITVCTYDDLQAAQEKASIRHVLFVSLYALEVAAVLFLYVKKRAK